MQLPGFTAETSLNKGSTFFHAAAGEGARIDLGVLAQLRVIGDPVGSCFSWCFLNGGSPLQCFFACGPGQLGGPGLLNVGFLS
jgi:hypothetical protein